ncbi:MAG: H-type lectin domain-containing protein [Paracoccus sp. (in: a-proteobacteria)]|nr:H-type lectin domain-containing protein [Paracoccus sp. (in: a-proteobacteria)]MDO5613038.1 H-type lectin domain-containing protein [Paracoccus sp. (in: a-proteobacteria)]
MLRISHHAVGVTRGSAVLFSAYEDGGLMWTGEGPRMERQRISFDEPFLAPPVVHVSIAMWDIEGGTNQRADISADQITPEGFDIVFRTWGDTRVARIRADWLAIGQVLHDEDWDI